MGTKKLLEQIQNLENQIIVNEINKNTPPQILQEMKKIGIERLPYSYSAIERFVDKETMNVHYNKHYKSYVEKLNKAIENKSGKDKTLEEIIKTISSYNRSVKDNAGGAFNHALFWKMLSPKKQRCTGEIYDKIIKDYKTFNNFKKEFESVAQKRFGSGWVWLVLTKNNTLKIMSTPNQDNPLMNTIKGGGFPLLGLDLWEHSYYLKYRNKRDDYIKNFWSVVNWSFVNKLYQSQGKKVVKENRTVTKELLIESESVGCAPYEVKKTIRMFNTNRGLVKYYSTFINRLFEKIFKDYWRKETKDELSGVYDFKYGQFNEPGRSVLNFVNTNATVFCLLKNDVNQVLRTQNVRPINFNDKDSEESFKELKRFIYYLNLWGYRVFDYKRPSKTFVNMYNTLGYRHQQGEKNELESVRILKSVFGDENVIKTGELGNKKDAYGGEDVKIITPEGEKTAQVKPFSKYEENEGKVTVFDTGVTKPYKTDYMVFYNRKKGVIYFDNSNTTINDNGQYVFNINDLRKA